ncbi:hypothetical protein [Verrucomicrobium spinosum]|uniref:hypothetical protein n=1 Tax=Verrucomicrobium spinosum TaxID=2736 RepID=UPI0012E13122|nr:hypothetical protein [Verrucomicrobium spinosum]
MVKAGSTSVGVTLAFNTIGVHSQNLLFNTIDALLDTDIADLADTTRVLVQGSNLEATGSLVISATSSAVLDAWCRSLRPPLISRSLHPPA